MKKSTLVIAGFVGAVIGAVLATLIINDVRSGMERANLIEELTYESLNGDTTRYVGTQRRLDSLRVLINKEYDRTLDHETKMELLGQLSDLENANMYNSTKKTSMDIERMQTE
jgi:hypothetical protein